MKILYVSTCSFPFGSAYSLRIRSILVELQKRGNTCVALSESLSVRKTKPGEVSDSEYAGIRVYTIHCSQNRLKEEYEWFMSRGLQRVLEKERPDIVISSSLREKMLFVLRICSNKKIKVVLESCEDFHPSTFCHGRLNWNYWMHKICWQFVYPRVDGVIAISRYLENHYKQYTNSVLRIPTILNVKSVPFCTDVSNSEKVKLLFAGTMARTKDSILPFVEAIDQMGELGRRFEIHICGESEKAVEMHLGQELYGRNQEGIVCHGRIPQEKINEMYRNCDFGIFFRPHIWSSEAGFSTKLGEGMAAGAPFIVNDTGDIALYVRNGENGFLIQDESIEGVKRILTDVLNLPSDQRIEMRKNARKTAEAYFNAEVYASQLNSLIEKVYRGE